MCCLRLAGWMRLLLIRSFLFKLSRILLFRLARPATSFCYWQPKVSWTGFSVSCSIELSSSNWSINSSFSWYWPFHCSSFDGFSIFLTHFKSIKKKIIESFSLSARFVFEWTIDGVMQSCANRFPGGDIKKAIFGILTVFLNSMNFSLKLFDEIHEYFQIQFKVCSIARNIGNFGKVLKISRIILSVW